MSKGAIRGILVIATNKKALFNYFILEKFSAGIVLTGTEIKSIREKKVSINESFCFLNNNEIFIKQMHIPQYNFGNIYNHYETRIRKLLLQKKEIKKIKNKLEKGMTILPLRLFLNEKNLAKVEIALAKGKKLYDKRNAIKERDLKRKYEYSFNK
jgi:SsrA-binding protein